MRRDSIRIGFPWWLRPFLMRGVEGITIGRRVYVARDDESLIRHELVHVKQIERIGAARFYWRYFVEYIRNRRSGMSSDEAYRNISFEREATYNQPLTMIQFHSLDTPQLERFLERSRSGLSLKAEGVDLDLVLRQILQKAYEFVPSESGSILLDDPFRKLTQRSENELVFIATFGESSRGLIGKRLSAQHGIVGRVYQNGAPYLSADVGEDRFFYEKIDEEIGHKTHSIVAVPIYIGKTVCGVLELVNRLEGKSFTQRDMTLLEIFAGYTSFMLQNALDAKRAHELAKRDDLTGLFNDRWFNVRLTEALTEARASGKEAVLIFMDLDRFKVVNDCHGHLAGSQVLREVGFLLKRVVSHDKATVARYGGDEFVMILPETKLEAGIEICNEIRHTIETNTFLAREWGFSNAPLNIHGILSASLGVAEHIPNVNSSTPIEQEKSELLRRADAAMYKAKSLGKNQVVVLRANERISDAAGGELSEAIG